MVIDFFDVVDMIDIVLEDKRYGSVNCFCVNIIINEINLIMVILSFNIIFESFGMVMIVVVFVSLFMLFW